MKQSNHFNLIGIWQNEKVKREKRGWLPNLVDFRRVYQIGRIGERSSYFLMRNTEVHYCFWENKHDNVTLDEVQISFIHPKTIVINGRWRGSPLQGSRSGNKRTNKNQSFDQKFENMNEALRVSCLKGNSVRVVRSFKEKRSSYALSEGVRYDGLNRIEKCWRKVGKQGCKVGRYLFVRCDNEPATWTSDESGDRPRPRPRPLPKIKELKNSVDLTERKGAPSWDYDEEKGFWL